MSLVVASSSPTDALLAAVAEAHSVTINLGGSVDLPPLPASRTVDIPTAGDDDAFSAAHWSKTMPHGFGVAQRRASSSYDADVLDYFRQLAQLEEEYAAGLQRLSERQIGRAHV